MAGESPPPPSLHPRHRPPCLRWKGLFTAWPGPGGSPGLLSQSDGGHRILTNVMPLCQLPPCTSSCTVSFLLAGAPPKKKKAFACCFFFSSSSLPSAGLSRCLAGDPSHFSLPHHLPSKCDSAGFHLSLPIIYSGSHLPSPPQPGEGRWAFPGSRAWLLAIWATPGSVQRRGEPSGGTGEMVTERSGSSERDSRSVSFLLPPSPLLR